MSRPNKQALLDALRARLLEERQGLLASQRSAQEGATHAEARQEHPKDTRAIEAQYVARGFAERAEELDEMLGALGRFRVDSFGDEDPIAASALVGLDCEGKERCYLLVPVGGGTTLEDGGVRVQALTLGSPLGKALTGRRVGESFELELPGRRMQARVAWVD